MTQPYAGRRVHGGRDRGRDERRGHLPHARRRVRRAHQLHVHLGDVAQPRHAVVVEVRLLDHPVFDADALSQRKAETVDNRALGLGHDVVGLHRDPGVDSAPELVHTDHAARAVHRNLRHPRNHRVGVVDEGEADAASGTQPPIVGHLEHGVDDGLPAR